MTDQWLDEAQKLLSVTEVLEMLPGNSLVQLIFTIPGHPGYSRTGTLNAVEALFYMEHINMVTGLANRPVWKITEPTD